jgi:anti-anti-sigma factor
VDLTLHRSIVGEVPVLAVVGEIDLASVPQFRDACVRLVADHPGRLVALDLDGVTVLDDAGLGIALGAADRARATGGDVVIVCSSERLLARFDRSGFDRAVDVRDRITP